MSVSNRLFKAVTSEFKSATDYKALKEHFNDIFSRFNGNRLSASKIDKYASLMLGGNNPNVLSNKMKETSEEDYFHFVEKINATFSKYLVLDGNPRQRYSSLFIPFYSNDFHNNNGDLMGKLYIGMRIMVSFENNVINLSIYKSVHNDLLETSHYSEYRDDLFKNKSQIVLLNSDRNFEKYTVNPETYEPMEIIKDVIKHRYTELQSKQDNKRLIVNAFQKLIINNLISDMGLDFHIDFLLTEYIKEIYSDDSNDLNGEKISFDLKSSSAKKEKYIGTIIYSAPSSIGTVNGDSPYYKTIIESDSELEIRERTIKYFKSIKTENKELINSIESVIKSLKSTSTKGVSRDNKDFEIGFDIHKLSDNEDI